jgi:hypothetical protein
MDFKEQVAADFDSVLMNTEEFGRICAWNGHPLKIVESAVLDLEKREAEGVNIQRKRIVCRDIDLNPHPVPTEEVNFDGVPWIVWDVQKPMAHLIIILERRAA